jgi:sulfite exporter TauE/SafE
MQPWTAFVIGFVGSLHCAGMCGPLVLAMPLTPGRFFPHLAGKLAYNGGRILTYSILGMISGQFGGALGLPGFQRWISIGAGTAVIATLVLWPFGNASGLINRPINVLKFALGKLLKARGIPAQACFGILNGLLPCGLVYLGCLAAAASGGALAGLKYMALFGLGTVPMMLGLALAGRALHLRLQLPIRKLVPVSLGVMAGLLILRGLGLGIPYLSPHIDPNDQGESSCCAPNTLPSHGGVPAPAVGQ